MHSLFDFKVNDVYIVDCRSVGIGYWPKQVMTVCGFHCLWCAAVVMSLALASAVCWYNIWRAMFHRWWYAVLFHVIDRVSMAFGHKLLCTKEQCEALRHKLESFTDRPLISQMALF